MSWSGRRWHRPPKQLGLLQHVEEQNFAAAFNGARPLSEILGQGQHHGNDGRELADEAPRQHSARTASRNW